MRSRGSHEVTPEWLDRVRATLAERGWSYRKLVTEASSVAAKHGASISIAMVGKLLKPATDGSRAPSTSALVPVLSQVLGIPTATIANPELTDPQDPREVALLSAFRDLPDEQKEHLIAFLSDQVRRR